MPVRDESMIARVVRILEASKVHGRAISVPEVSRATGIPLPSAYRITGELRDLGVLESDAAGRLRPGMRLWEIVTRSARVPTLCEVARPYLEDLRDAVCVPILLSIFDCDDMVNVDTVAPRGSDVFNISRPGMRLPMLGTSPGMILLAHSPADLRERILTSGKITRFTEYTETDRDQLRRIADDARARGCMIAERWMSPGSTGTAVPVLAPGGVAVAALSVTTPSADGAPLHLLPAMRVTARAIGRGLQAETSPAYDYDPRALLLTKKVLHATERL
ncbi:IclR family transcriptional regulator [Tsukamurella sp. NPDC003166]|uniref:IclR family transcriptional regulator n=1 Tax=Tsukamurella sp. NPDC003166 TaxID=3154444 RepID=UPI0033B2B0A9